MFLSQFLQKSNFLPEFKTNHSHPQFCRKANPQLDGNRQRKRESYFFSEKEIDQKEIEAILRDLFEKMEEEGNRD